MTTTDPRLWVRGPASDRLTTALVKMATEGRRPPCAGSGSDSWLSNDWREREAAAVACGGCPVLDACDAAAEENGEVLRGLGRARPRK